VLPVTSEAGSLSWMLRGACRQVDPELFFPVAAATGPAARQAEAAKAVCGPCAVRANCLSYALEAMPEGIWGGTTLEERLAARRRSFRRQASAQSPGVVGAAMTGESATCAGHAARQRVPPGRTR
jgi:WhiB family redox-sensing transcriptional regulator